MFLNDKDTQILENGQVLVIKPKNDLIVPLFCPTCTFPIRTLEDVLSFRVFSCCNHCELRWTTTKLGSWTDGWRPDNTTDGWEEYIKARKVASCRLINLR
jgi:hypothetical protein